MKNEAETPSNRAWEEFMAVPHGDLPGLAAARSCPVRSAGGKWWALATQHAAGRRAPAFEGFPVR